MRQIFCDKTENIEGNFYAAVLKNSSVSCSSVKGGIQKLYFRFIISVVPHCLANCNTGEVQLTSQKLDITHFSQRFDKSFIKMTG